MRQASNNITLFRGTRLGPYYNKQKTWNKHRTDEQLPCIIKCVSRNVGVTALERSVHTVGLNQFVMGNNLILTDIYQ